MKIVVFTALGLLVGVLVFVWLVSRVRYRIGSRHLKVSLFGIVFRRIDLSSIESISKRRTDGMAEHWWSTMRPKHRVLVLRRNRGLVRNFVITPKNRYIFKADLERAMDRVAGREPSRQSLADSVTMEGGSTDPGSSTPEERSATEDREELDTPERQERA